MDKPPELALKLYRMQPIRVIEVDYHQTGTDTADTFVKLKGYDGEVTSGKWETYSKYLNVHVGYNFAAELTREWDEKVRQWLAYEIQNAAEISLLRKLKAKHGDV